MGGIIEGRTTVYNEISSDDKLKLVNSDNVQLGDDFLDYLSSIDRASGTIHQYRSNLRIFWCWNLDYNNNKPFTDITKREAVKFQNMAINEWGWSPRRVRTFKATLRSMENYITDILDDEFPDYKKIWHRIESPADEAVRTKSVFSDNDIQGLLDALMDNKNYQLACYLAVAVYSGRRKSEVTRFKVGYFDEHNLICDGALYKTPEKMVTKGRGQRGKLLDVYVLAKPFRPYFDAWMRYRNEVGIDSIWLFPKEKNEDGKDEHIDPATIDSWSRVLSRMAGKQMYPHALRHFFTTHLLEQNLPESVVQSIVGWSSGEMLKLYDDRTTESQFEKYFGADGVRKIEQTSVNDL